MRRACWTKRRSGGPRVLPPGQGNVIQTLLRHLGQRLINAGMEGQTGSSTGTWPWAARREAARRSSEGRSQRALFAAIDERRRRQRWLVGRPLVLLHLSVRVFVLGVVRLGLRGGAERWVGFRRYQIIAGGAAASAGGAF